MLTAGKKTVAGPYRVLLGHRFASLNPFVQRAHDVPLAAEGSLDVEHGSHWLVPVLVRLMNLPHAGIAQPTRLDVASDGSDSVWTRTIGASRLRTRQRAEGSLLVERLAIGRVSFALEVEQGALRYRQVSMYVLGIHPPASIAPTADARISGAPDGWHVDVRVTWRKHLVCHYDGVMRSI